MNRSVAVQDLAAGDDEAAPGLARGTLVGDRHSDSEPIARPDGVAERDLPAHRGDEALARRLVDRQRVDATEEQRDHVSERRDDAAERRRGGELLVDVDPPRVVLARRTRASLPATLRSPGSPERTRRGSPRRTPCPRTLPSPRGRDIDSARDQARVRDVAEEHAVGGATAALVFECLGGASQRPDDPETTASAADTGPLTTRPRHGSTSQCDRVAELCAADSVIPSWTNDDRLDRLKTEYRRRCEAGVMLEGGRDVLFAKTRSSRTKLGSGAQPEPPGPLCHYTCILNRWSDGIITGVRDARFGA